MGRRGVQVDIPKREHGMSHDAKIKRRSRGIVIRGKGVVVVVVVVVVNWPRGSRQVARKEDGRLISIHGRRKEREGGTKREGEPSRRTHAAERRTEVLLKPAR